MQEEKDNLQNEIETMNNSTVDSAATSNDDDIIEINVGGKMISARRSTLTLAPDTMFSSMFSERWDNNDPVYLDHDPELIEIVVNFLRTKKIEDPSNPMKSPTIPDGKKKEFEILLRYFGLSDFFYPPLILLPLDIANIEVVQKCEGPSVTVTKSDNKIQFNKVTGGNSYDFLACEPSLNASSDEGSFWKVTLGRSDWIFLGIIGNLGADLGVAPSISASEPTSYGWSSTSQVWHAGSNRNGDSGWTRFTQGECLHFHLKSNKLTMFSVQKNKKFVIDIDTTVPAYYIHFSIFFAGTKFTLEPLGEDECERMLEN